MPHPEAGLPRRLSRRQALKAAGAGAIAVSAGAGAVLLRSSSPHRRHYPSEEGWTRDRTLVTRGPVSDLSHGVLFVTLMHVADKLSNPHDAWYLWHSTHDSSVFRLYSAPSPEGPFTERPCSLPPLPVGYWTDPQVHDLGAGDVVWEAPYLYTTPRNHRHYTFLLRSTDGSHWTYMPEFPVIYPGRPGAFDDLAASYGRFLRTFDGQLARIDGRAIWYYRGEPRFTPYYRVGVAASSDLIHWTKLNAGEPIFDPQRGQLCALGSALWQPQERRAYLVLSVNQRNPTLFIKRAREDYATWDDGPGRAVYQAPEAVFLDGASYALDRARRRQYMAQARVVRGARPMKVDLLSDEA